ncbi:MAG TPA: hypothetical protein VFR87_06925 [Nocardioidaceae bacterium]|nr:hypothetical protein [Nocardioidaceae bacterium]
MEQRDSGRLEDVFEDLEQQAAGIELVERDAELADRARGEYAAVTLADRVHASLGRRVVLVLLGGESVTGELVDAGRDWCAVTSSQGRSWLVRLAAVAQAGGLSPRSLPEAARPVLARRGFASALHRFAEESWDLLLHVATGSPLRGRIVRVGADFVEVELAHTRSGAPVLVATESVRAVTAG